ncbi:MAG TPA: heme-degrading domain-containing protein [Acidobacteriaceae bacterium]|nr:heme-degrading domain-containing protein [Acidobacteriaceae bacterium]
MPLADDIAALVKQEATLTLPAFTPDTAWQLGNMLREMAVARKTPIVVDVRRFGAPHQQLFYTALAGTTPDNQRWVARKIATVARFHKSSYHVGRLLEQSGLSFSARYNLPEEDYAAHGGCFPLIVENAGIVGAVTVSGLPQREDHNLVVEALCTLTGRDLAALRLPPE